MTDLMTLAFGLTLLARVKHETHFDYVSRGFELTILKHKIIFYASFVHIFVNLLNLVRKKDFNFKFHIIFVIFENNFISEIILLSLIDFKELENVIEFLLQHKM